MMRTRCRTLGPRPAGLPGPVTCVRPTSGRVPAGRSGGTRAYLLAALAVCLGCTTQESWPCPALQVATRTADSGQQQWTLADAATGATVAATAPGTVGQCQIRLEGLGSLAADTGQSWLAEWVIGQCATEVGGVQVDFLLPDPRGWTAGDHTVQTSVRIQYPDTCPATGGCGACVASLKEVQLQVTELQGSRADWPQVATPDFLRTYHVQMATPTQGVRGVGAQGDCGQTVRGQISAGFSLKAIDLHPEPDRMCDAFSTHGEREAKARTFNEAQATP